MGSFDCYCAICGGPLHHNLQFGSKSAKALVRRKKRVEKEKRRRDGETDLPNSDDDDEGLKDDSEGAISSTEMVDREESADGDGEDDEDFDPWEEDRSYNPELVSETSTEWVGECRCLGFNADAPGITK
jgi:hypothetical protein